MTKLHYSTIAASCLALCLAIGCEGDPCPDGTDYDADPAGRACGNDDDCLVTCVVHDATLGDHGREAGECNSTTNTCTSGNSVCLGFPDYMGRFCAPD